MYERLLFAVMVTLHHETRFEESVFSANILNRPDKSSVKNTSTFRNLIGGHDFENGP